MKRTADYLAGFGHGLSKQAGFWAKVPGDNKKRRYKNVAEYNARKKAIAQYLAKQKPQQPKPQQPKAPAAATNAPQQTASAPAPAQQVKPVSQAGEIGAAVARKAVSGSAVASSGMTPANAATAAGVDAQQDVASAPEPPQTDMKAWMQWNMQRNPAAYNMLQQRQQRMQQAPAMAQ